MNTDRIHKGKNQYLLPSDYVAIDTETTGLDPARDDIIELAAVRVRDGQPTETYQTLVKPPFPIDAFITELTGITNEMLKDAPAIQNVIADYVAFLGDDIILGHNVNFDINFIYDASIQHAAQPVGNHYVDTMGLARRIFPEWKHHRLGDLIESFHLQGGDAHRALADAYYTKGCYDALRCAMDTKGLTLEAIKPVKQTYARDLRPQTEQFDIGSPIYRKTFVFTGAMERMVRKDAMQTVLNLGGYCGDSVNQDTNFLVLGNAGYSITLVDGKSAKRRKAEKFKAEGEDIEIISEDVFLDMLDD